jgi:hypothetical protein
MVGASTCDDMVVIVGERPWWSVCVMLEKKKKHTQSCFQTFIQELYQEEHPFIMKSLQTGLYLAIKATVASVLTVA